MAEEARSGVGRGHGTPPSRALEQLHPGGALQGGDLLADRRLRVPERGTGPMERSRLGYRLEGREVPDLDLRQQAMVSDRFVH